MTTKAAGDARGRAGRAPDWRLLALLGLLGAVAAVHSLIDRHNFSGWDEWLVLDLASRGVLGFPHANRPLALLWVVPAPWLSPLPLDGFHYLHLVYVLGIGIATLAIARRLLGGVLVPWCAGLVAALWAPTDTARLDSVLTAATHVSAAFAAVLAMALLAESWFRRKRWLLVLAALVALAAVRSYEPVAVLLVGAPLVVWATPGRARRQQAEWLLVFGASLAVGGLLASIPPADSVPGQLYQQAVSMDPHPGHVLSRLAIQLQALLAPAFVWPSGVTLAALVAPLVVLLAGAALALLEPAGAAPPRPVPPLRVALIAASWLLLGLIPFSLSAAFRPGVRAQFLSAPGVGLGVAVLLAALGDRLASRLRAALVLSAAVWLVLVAAGRTVSMQREWDTASTWPRQRSLLSQLVSVAPGLRDGTLLILIDESGTFDSTFAFRHAVHFLYAGRASGWVFGAKDLDLFYPTRLQPDGVHADVWRMHQRAWGEAPRVYAYRQTVVVWVDAQGRLRLLDRWPSGVLPAWPSTAQYAPRARVITGTPSSRARRLLADVR